MLHIAIFILHLSGGESKTKSRQGGKEPFPAGAGRSL